MNRIATTWTYRGGGLVETLWLEDGSEACLRLRVAGEPARVIGRRDMVNAYCTALRRASAAAYNEPSGDAPATLVVMRTRVRRGRELELAVRVGDGPRVARIGRRSLALGAALDIVVPIVRGALRTALSTRREA